MLDNRHIEALNLLKSGLTQREVAEKIGVEYQTIRNWCSGDPALGTASVEFGELYKSYRKEVHDETRQDVEDTLKILANKFKVWASKCVSKKPSQEDRHKPLSHFGRDCPSEVGHHQYLQRRDQDIGGRTE